MPVKKSRLKRVASIKRSRARLSPYVRGLVFGMHLAGATLPDIEATLTKPDGTTLSQPGAWNCIQMCEENGGVKWDGVVNHDSDGRPRDSTPAMDRALIKLVFKHRGSVIVTTAFLKQQLPAWRQLCDRTVQRRLGEAGLAWLRRRRKSMVPDQHKEHRMRWGRWVKRQPASNLDKWAYTDGAVWYLGRTRAEAADQKRAALGTHVWRHADGSDALFEGCVGPSAYWKAQGRPVRVWGVLTNGMLFITVLKEGVVMNRWEYDKVVRAKFPVWIQEAYGVQKRGVSLVQDHERCLWTKEAREAIESINVHLLENYPKCSQDLNPIETAWREVRNRLYHTQPNKQETRSAFVLRLRAAVSWTNRNRADFYLHICNNQVQLAKDVLASEGRRTAH